MIKLSSPSNDLTTSNDTVFNFTYDSTSSKYGYLNSSGTFVPFEDSSDATASAATIISGYTAYVNGSKITGEASAGTDTSDGTITNAEQILAGLVGYSKGIRYVGTGIMKPNYEVIMIYNGQNNLTRVTLNIHRYRDNATQSVTTYSRDVNYTVSNSDYIDNFKISEVSGGGRDYTDYAYIHFTKKVNYIQTSTNTVYRSSSSYYLTMNYTNGIIEAAAEVSRPTFNNTGYSNYTYYSYTLIIWPA